MGAIAIGTNEYYPYAYISAPESYCEGLTEDGCELMWQEVETIEGDVVNRHMSDYLNANAAQSGKRPSSIDVFRRLVMSSKHNVASRLLAVFVLSTLSFATVAEAQPSGPGRGGPDGPGYMMGPGMMDRGHFGRMCSPRSAGFAEWRLDRLEEVVKPTDAQRAKFDEFKASSNKAAETMRAACSTDIPTTMVGRMEAMEKRLEAMLGAVKTVRPAFAAFYATLSDEQKASLNVRSGPRWFWRWRDRW